MNENNDKKPKRLDTGDKILILVSVIVISSFIVLTFYEGYLEKEEELPFIEKTVLHYANIDNNTQTFTITTNGTEFYAPQRTTQHGITWELQSSEVIKVPDGKLVLGYDKNGYFCKVVNKGIYYPLDYCKESIDNAGLNFDEIEGDKLQ